MLPDGPHIADKTEYADITEIWRKCFGDSEEYIRNFFGALEGSYIPLVYRKDGKPVSAFFALPCTFRNGNREEKALYMYAGCTDPDFRGNGYFGELVKLAEKLAADDGVRILFLVPGEESLCGYYERFGYVNCMTKRIYSMSRTQFASSEQIEKKPVPEFVWDDKVMAYAVTENPEGKHLCSEGCRAHISEAGKTAVVYECRFGDYAKFKETVLNGTDSEYYEIYVDSGTGLTGGEYRTIRRGMVRMPGVNADDVGEICRDAYIGLAFE